MTASPGRPIPLEDRTSQKLSSTHPHRRKMGWPANSVNEVVLGAKAVLIPHSALSRPEEFWSE